MKGKWRVKKTTGPIYWAVFAPGKNRSPLFGSWAAAYRYAYDCANGFQQPRPC